MDGRIPRSAYECNVFLSPSYSFLLILLVHSFSIYNSPKFPIPGTAMFWQEAGVVLRPNSQLPSEVSSS